jgi:hypothetical protein
MSKKISLTLMASCMLLLSFAQTGYYVDQINGSDTNNGTSAATAYKTFDKAKNQVTAGDTISIIGVYANSSYNPNFTYTVPHDAHLWHRENTIRITGLNGSNGNYITIKGFDSNAVIKGDGSNIIRVTNSSYLKFENLTIEGEVDRIPLSTANALQFVYVLGNGVTNPAASDIHYRNEDETNDNDNVVEETDTYTSLGSVTRPSYIDTRGLYISGSDNIIIKNNTIHHTPGGGLRVSDSKFVDIIGNEIYRCSARSYSGTHALVVTKTKPIGNNGYSINILKNNIHHNYNEQFSWAPTKTIITPRIDEGKGISLQRNNLSSWINGQGRILVQNNLCYWNGFSGVHSNDGYRIDFINNTCYMNSYTNSVEPYGSAGSLSSEGQQGKNIGISAQGGDDIKMINNISVVDTDWNGFALASGGTTNLTVSDNLIFGINGTVNEDNDIASIDVNTTIDNPLFVNAPTNYLDETNSFDFNLQQTSPAIDASDNSVAPTDDFFGNTRDSNADIGAIEFGATLGIDDLATTNFIIYPNPFNESVKINGVEQIETLEIFTITGQKLLLDDISMAKNQTQSTINLSGLANGIYLLRVNNTIKKIIKKYD